MGASSRWGRGGAGGDRRDHNWVRGNTIKNNNAFPTYNHNNTNTKTTNNSNYINHNNNNNNNIGGRGMVVPRHRQRPLRVNTWSSAFSSSTINKPYRRSNKQVVWSNELFNDSMVAAGLETGTKLYVSNLDYRVSNDDIKQLFSEFGELKRYTIHYDKNGRSIGSAEIVFTRQSDALAARKRYDNVQLDGKPMKVQVIGGISKRPPISARVNVTGGGGRGKRTVILRPELDEGKGSTSFGGRRSKRGHRGSKRKTRGRGRGAGHARRKPVEKSADELDKDLENYHAGVMNTS